MTKKDYEAIAAAFHGALQSRKIAWAAANDAGKQHMGDQIVGYQDAINMVASVLAADNPRFDRERFLKACDVIDSSIKWSK